VRAFLSASNRRFTFGVCGFLLLAIWFVFGKTLHHEFVNFDDDLHVYENSTVRAGLTAHGIVWAFTHTVASNWHPLTTISHMLDWQLYGLNAGGHHLTNVVLHAMTAILLFLVLGQLTAAYWPSAFVAALFALHPLRVESVAWVTERKDVLSGLFFMLTLAAYVRYVESPQSRVHGPESTVQSPESEKAVQSSTPKEFGVQFKIQSPLSTLQVSRSALRWYCLTVVFFVLGLMSKPMLVTLPLVLLLLDYWPLARFQPAAGDRFFISRQLLVEKIPLLVLSVAMAIGTLLFQAESMPTLRIPLSFRITNSLVSAALYCWQLFFPFHLAVLYPLPRAAYPYWQIALALFLLGALTLIAFRSRKKRPYLFVGWLWYLIMLLPVSGLIQVGAQAHADRFTYLPEIGLCLAITWSLAVWSARWHFPRALLGAGAAIILAALAVAARVQTTYWRDSESLWNHTLACTTRNAVAENNLAAFLLGKGQLDDALTHASAAAEIDPLYEDAETSIGLILASRGQLNDAIPHYRQALRIKPGFVPALINLGAALMQTGQVDEAIDRLQEALKARPDRADIHSDLGSALLLKGETEAAVAHYQRALELRPDYLGDKSNLAWVLATSSNPGVRNGSRAIQLAQEANQLSGGKDLRVLHVLAAAYAEGGRFPDAIATAEQALRLADAAAEADWRQRLEGETNLYHASKPLREAGQTP
jgi:tetratricopeptide (TPR) repeat protein